MILNFVGLFLLMAGFIIGLGAVTVIDIHGFLGRKSRYWTEATTRTHKVTKPMIWVGITLCLLGGFIFFRNETSSLVPMYLLGIALVLIVNGIFLSFRVSPYMLEREKEGKDGELLPKSWQNKIIVSLIFSDLGWWGGLFLVIFYILFQYSVPVY
jgi:magnesium-transporting ATPase (P-type)